MTSENVTHEVDGDLTDDCVWALEGLAARGLDQESIALVAVAMLVAAAAGANMTLRDTKDVLEEAWDRYADACQALKRSLLRTT